MKNAQILINSLEITAMSSCYHSSKLKVVITCRGISLLDVERTWVCHTLSHCGLCKYFNQNSSSLPLGTMAWVYVYLRKIVPVFPNPLCKLLNLSISTNSFPNHWNKQFCESLNKGGAWNDMKHYRLISVLYVLSKILRKHVL